MRSRTINKFSRNERMAILVILLVSLTIRVAFVMTMDPEGFYFTDTIFYDGAAVSLVKSGTFGTEYGRPPLYPVFLASIYCFSYQNFLLVRIVQSVLGSVVCILIFLIARKLYGVKAALIAGLIASIYPIFIFISGLLAPTTVIIVWLLLLIFFLLRALDRESLADFSIAGLFMGLAILTKPVAIVFLVLLILYFVIKKDLLRTKKALPVFLFIICACAVTSVWVVRNYHVKGEISVIESNRRLDLVLRNLFDSEKEEQLQRVTLRDKLNRIVFHRKAKLLRHFVSEAIHFWGLYPDRVQLKDESKRELVHSLDQRLEMDNPYVGDLTKYISIESFTPVLLLAIIGFLFSLGDRKRLFLLVTPIASFWFGYSLFFTQIRYRIPIEPFLIILAAFGLVTLASWLSGHSSLSPGQER